MRPGAWSPRANIAGGTGFALPFAHGSCILRGMSALPYKHLYLVDGSGYIFRAYFAIPPRNASDGTPTNAAYDTLFTSLIVSSEILAPALNSASPIVTSLTNSWFER